MFCYLLFLGMKNIHSACQDGSVEELQQLLIEGANLDEKDNSGWTPLHYACKYGHVDVVKLLIERGVELEAQDHHW